MGDRTYVEITLRKSDFNNIKDKVDEQEWKYTDIDDSSEAHVVRISQDEVNYADWENVESVLREHKIEYDKTWSAGCEYTAGWSVYRWIKGEYHSFEMYESEEQIYNYLKNLLEKSKKDPKKIIELIEAGMKAQKPFEPSDLNVPNSVKFIKGEKV